MLHRLFAVAGCLIALLIAGLAIQSVSAQSTTWTPELSLTIKRIPAVVPSPDGTKVAFAVSEAAMEDATSEWLSQIHVANTDGTESRQLTRGDKSATLPRWSPDGKWIGFITSRSGTANVWRISVAGGEAEQVTKEKGGVTTFDWSPQGSSVAFIMPDPKSDQEEKDEKEKRDWRTIDENVKLKRLYVQAVEPDANRDRKPRKLTTANYSVEEFDWSPDGHTIAFRHQPTASANDWPKGDISIVTVKTDATRTLVSTDAAEISPRFSPDGSRIAFVASQIPAMWAATDKVVIVPAAGGPPQPLGDTFDQQPVIVDWTSDGTSVLVSEVNRTVPTLYALPVNGGAPVRIGSGAHMSAPAVNTRASHLGFVSQDYDKAPEAFIAKLGGAFSAVQVSHVQPRIEAPIGRSEVLTWKSFDGQTIEGVLTYPVNYGKGTRAPLLVIIHGGPTGVFANTFVGSIGSPHPVAVFAARGYAVLRVNPRGSSGYGQPFRYANMRDWGGGDYKDIMSGVDHVIGLGIADPDRLGVMGWSYGGFMTSWIVTQTQRFKAASAGAAVTNLISFTGTSDITGFIPNYFGGEFWNVFEAWRAHSPVLNVRGVKTPTLIQHGEADVRVPITQSYEFYQALKRQGVTTKMTVYPRQPHGFLEPKMTLDAAKANVEWFDRFVKGTVAITSAK